MYSFRASMVLAGVLTHAVLAQQPAQPAPTGVIAGLTATADTGQPLRKAQVKLTMTTTRTTVTTVSDGDGRFVFSGVRAGEYTLSASKPSYLDMVFGARRHGATVAGTPIRMAAGQKIDNLELRLPRASAITGTVTDEYGDPAFNTAVRVMRFVYSNGERYATPAGSDISDDRGFYRVSGLTPGEYVVSAVPRDIVSQVAVIAELNRERVAKVIAAAKAQGNAVPAGLRPDVLEELNKPVEMRGYVPVHYPGAVLPSGAGSVRVGLSEEVSGIDVRLQLVHTANVTGTVSWAEGAVPATARVQLLDPALPMPTIGAWWTSMKAGGKFIFYGVTPGAYVVRMTTSSGGTDLIASADIQVDPARTNDVELRLQRGPTISGSVSLEGATVAMSRLRVVLNPVPLVADPEMGMERVPVDATGRFVFRGITPARYRVSMEGLPAGWSIGSAMFGEKEAADFLLEAEVGRNLTGVIKLTSRLGEIAGMVSNASSQPVVNSTVLVFPIDRRLWVAESRRIQTATLAADGRYVVRGLPPGEYAIALVDPEPDQQFDVEYLAQLVGASTVVTLADGEKRVQDIRIK